LLRKTVLRNKDRGNKKYWINYSHNSFYFWFRNIVIGPLSIFVPCSMLIK